MLLVLKKLLEYPNAILDEAHFMCRHGGMRRRCRRPSARPGDTDRLGRGAKQCAGQWRAESAGRAVLARCCPKTSNGSRFAAFPPEARLAVLVGEPTKAGPYVVRVKLPGGVKLMPHTHPEDRIYTVVSGVFYIGLGTTFDPDKAAGVCAGLGHRPASQHAALSLGEVRRLHDPGCGHRPTGHQVCRPSR